VSMSYPLGCSMNDDRTLAVFTIYYGAAPFPNCWTVVRTLITGTVVRVDGTFRAIAGSLDAARLIIPPGLTCLDRHPDDDPTIVETWL
jgi:hypothetical protein